MKLQPLNILLATILVAATFLFSCATGLAQQLLVRGGFGTGTFSVGDSAFAYSNPTPANNTFVGWQGNAGLKDTFSVATKVRIASGANDILATYAPAPTWQETTDTLNGSKVIYFFPQGQIKGLILFYHGSNGNASSWFDKIENRLFLNYAVYKKYAVLATESRDRVTGGNRPYQWSNATTVNANPDIKNLDLILDTLVARQLMARSTKVFGVGFSQGSGFGSIIAALKQHAGNALGATPGIAQVMAVTTSPTYWMASRQDLNADPQRLQKCYQNFATLSARSIPTLLKVHEPFPITPNRFWKIPGIDSAASVAIYNILKSNNLLDGRDFVNFNPDASTAWKNFLLPTFSNFADEIEDQVIIAYTEHKFHADQMHDVIGFFDRFAATITSSKVKVQNKSQLALWPNPSSGTVTMVAPQAGIAKIISADGSCKILDVVVGKHQYDFSTLPRGIYMLSFLGTCTRFVLQ